MGFLKRNMQYIVILLIVIASLFARNMISYPLGFDFSCSRGVPLAIWEQCSLDGTTSVKLISGAYKSSAVPFATGSALLNFLIDFMLIISLCCFPLQKSKGDKTLRCIRIIAYCFVLCLLCSLGVSIFAGWSNDLYRVVYSNVIVLYVILFLLSVIKVLYIFRLKRKYPRR